MAPPFFVSGEDRRISGGQIQFPGERAASKRVIPPFPRRARR